MEARGRQENGTPEASYAPEIHLLLGTIDIQQYLVKKYTFPASIARRLKFNEYNPRNFGSGVCLIFYVVTVEGSGWLTLRIPIKS